MTTVQAIILSILALFAGVSLVALFTRRIGNSRQEAGPLFLTTILLATGSLALTVFIDRFDLTPDQRWWAMRVGFVTLTLVLWRKSHVMWSRSAG
jgi:hypothetical protein